MDIKSIERSLPNSFNKFGEAPLRNSPVATLANGVQAVPQQFFNYCRTVENIEAIVECINFSKDFPIFVFEENGHVFLQVGIIGHENYPPQKKSTNKGRNDKIVYGRRWYIEPYTPTSEVIQTAFLAINKVREHEVRELLTLSLKHRGKQHRATPFNSHIDLPLAAKNKSLFNSDDKETSFFEFTDSLADMMRQLTLGNCHLILEDATLIHKPYWFVTVRFEEKQSNSHMSNFMRKFFPELIGETIAFTTHACLSRCMHALISAIITRCEEYVAEHFTYDGFNRFSHHVYPDDLARFSLDTRLVNDQRTPDFNEIFRAMVHLVDGGKAPPIANTDTLAQKQMSSLHNRKQLEGYLPK